MNINEIIATIEDLVVKVQRLENKVLAMQKEIAKNDKADV